MEKQTGQKLIDTTYNVYDDSYGNDPDTYSPTLNHYHFLLWNKLLPSGKMFMLEKVITSKFHLKYTSDDNQLLLSSDSIIHPFHYWIRMQPIIKQFDERTILNFHNQGATIGGYIIFPCKQIDRKRTMNCARGMHGKIRDRFDLTLECIRLWYLDQDNPLYVVIERYKSFFELFVDFKGYVEFFLLQDLIDEKTQRIKFWLPYEDFHHQIVVPRDKDEYQLYMESVLSFVKLRNQRIDKWQESSV